jgi:hypothetical protein
MQKVKRFARDTSWDELGFFDMPGDAKISSFVLGDADDVDAPVVFSGWYPPGSRTEPHHHVTDYAEIIIEGTQQIGRTWHGPGTVRIVEAGTAYGPLVAGPEGCRTIVIFRTQKWQSIGGMAPPDWGPEGPMSFAL